MRTPSLKAIKTFQIAAKHTSFAVAADELCITPSAVSHQVRNLEQRAHRDRSVPIMSRSASPASSAVLVPSTTPRVLRSIASTASCVSR